MCEHGHCCIRGLLSACPQVCGRQSAARNVIVGGLLPGWLSAFMANVEAEWWSARLTGATSNYFSNCGASCGFLSLPTPPQGGHLKLVTHRLHRPPPAPDVKAMVTD